jgi:hypothetical protein
MTNDDESPGNSGRRSKLVRWLTALGLAGVIGVVADVSQVAGVNLTDAVQYLRGHHPSASPSAPGPSRSGPSAPAGSPSVPATPLPSAPPASAGNVGSGGGQVPSGNHPVRSSAAAPHVAVSTAGKSVQVSATARITAPADGLTTKDTSVRLSISAAPASVSGWVWYVVVQPAHHTTSDFLCRLRPETGGLSVGIGPASGGSGATDDYLIRPALIRAAAADTIGGYRDDVFAPADTRYFAGITVHRESQ